MKPTNKIMVVLGMHRSGTSALAGVLSILGCSYDYKLVPANEDDNPKGYWEAEDIVKINDEFLSAFDLHYIDFYSLPVCYADNTAIGTIRNKIDKWVLKRLSANDGLVAIKDPRLCRAMPIWRDSFVENEVNVSYIHIFRNPIDVVNSLRVRDTSLDKVTALLAWLAYTLDSFKFHVGPPRVIISFKKLLNQPIATLNTCSDVLGIKWPIEPDSVSSSILKYLDKNLEHHSSNDPTKKTILNNLASEVCDLLSTYELRILDTSFYANIHSLNQRFSDIRNIIESASTLKLSIKDKYISNLQNILHCEKINFNDQITYRDQVVSQLESKLKLEKINGSNQVKYRDSLLSELHIQLSDEKNNGLSQVTYRDDLIAALKSELQEEKRNGSEQIKYRDELISDLEIKLEREKENESSQVTYRDDLIAALKSELQEEKRNGSEQIKYRDELISELEFQLKSEKENEFSQVTYRDDLIAVLKSKLKEEKRNGSEQIKYRDALISNLETLLKREKENGFSQITYRDDFISELERNLKEEKRNGSEQIKYRDALISQLQIQLNKENDS